MTWLTMNAEWLLPPGLLAGCTGTVLAPAGELWDAVRTSTEHGRPVLERLLADDHDRDFVGPVVLDEVADWLYWLTVPGASDHYPAGCTLIGAGSLVILPAFSGARSRAARWLHLPDHRTLSGPAWLAAALDTHALPAA